MQFVRFVTECEARYSGKKLNEKTEYFNEYTTYNLSTKLVQNVYKIIIKEIKKKKTSKSN